MIIFLEVNRQMALIDDNQKSWNPQIGRVVRHKDKLEWCKQLYLRECMKRTPSLEFCRQPTYFAMYNPTWNILNAGWNPGWHMIADFPEEVELDEIIMGIDKFFGFVNIEEYRDELPEPIPEELEWYVDDQIYQRDIRTKCKEHRESKKYQKVKKIQKYKSKK